MIKAVLFDYGNVIYGPILPHPRVRKLAGELRTKGIKTGILSNVIFLIAWALKISGGYRNFDPLILSYKEKIAKPSEGIYDIAIKRLGVKPEEILFIDNRADNIEAAQRAGMKTVLAKNSSQIVGDVKTILLKENGLKLL